MSWFGDAESFVVGGLRVGRTRRAVRARRRMNLKVVEMGRWSCIILDRGGRVGQCER
jgi:hypothetical protein